MIDREKNLFLYIMEAETELASFDGGDASADVAPPMDDSAPPSNDDGADNPPELADDSTDSSTGLDSFDGSSDSDLDMGGEDGSSEDNPDGENKEDESMTEKANNLLNQKLYEQMCSRNDEIEKIIESLQTLTPVLPQEVIKENEPNISKLKAALNKSKDYAVNKFVDGKYGENLLFYNEINLLFTMLCDELDKNLKRNSKNN